MTPAFKREPEGGPLNTREDLVRLISDLARHLAVELDYHYEDEDARHLLSQMLTLENAVGVLLLNGCLAPKVVYHVTERFHVPIDEHGNPLDDEEDDEGSVDVTRH